MAGKLKVFRTAAGFHDAYIAAPSQKAALEAWGAHSNLFAQGMAEQVTDPDLTKAALAQPGQIIKLPRENPPDEPESPKRSNAAKISEAKPPAAPKPTPRPRPSRTSLDAAEHAEEQQQRDLAAQIDDLEGQRRTLATRIGELKASGATARAKLARRVAQEKEAHEAALEDWSREL